MTSSSDPPLERALDTMIVVYGLLESHPASEACERFIRDRAGWCTSALTLLEARAVLTKVYGVEPDAAAEKLALFASGPVDILPIEPTIAVQALRSAHRLRIDLTDAVLLETAHARQVSRLATDDRYLSRCCAGLGIRTENPVGTRLRAAIADWEALHLPQKGLPRLLFQVRAWLEQTHREVAHDFWSATGSGSHLP